MGAHRAGPALEPLEDGALKRSDLALACLCAAVGLLLAVAPHFATLRRHGTLEYLADTDDGIYLAVARAPYYGENGLRDAFAGRWERVPSLYSWAQFVPLARLTRALGLPLILMSLLWRVLGGSALGASLYILFRRMFAATRRPGAWALGASLFCLCDAGFAQGRVGVQSLVLAGHLLRGTTPMTKADGMTHLRVVQPLLHIPLLVLLVAALMPGRRRATTAALAALLLGALVHMNFFFWTGAILGISIYAAWLLLARRDCREAGFLCAVMAGGLLIGAPQILSNARAFARPEYKPIMDRLIRPIRLDPGDPFRRVYLRNFWVWGKLAAGAAGEFPGLGLLWCLTLAGYVLSNSAIATGLEFQNAHWFYLHAPLGEMLLLGAIVSRLDRRCAPERLRALWLVPAALGAAAFAWRPYEALRAPEAAEASRQLEELRPLEAALAAQPPDCVLAGPRPANTALLFSRCGQLYHFPNTALGSLIPDEQVYEHHALNAWLQGMTEAEYAEDAAKDEMSVLPIRGWDPATTSRRKTAVFKRLMEGGSRELLERYRPSVLLLPSSAPAPIRGGPWTPLAADAQWALYSRATASPR